MTQHITTPAALRRWRKRAGFTQPKAADFLRCGLRSYKEWELGERPIPGPVQVAVELHSEKIKQTHD